ncbi:ParB/RepB/Spo0J family partition protein [Sphingopyxis sp. SE2]|jgi:ParB family chromosome partitioning protein|uniref:ParB/RepB/Spo0J family partition protein n=1 Tax=unclassified Sphingopyxis TaxID=2614943 RepID=UPI00050ECCEF|nr:MULTISPECIES: ParB/RepB/Spo0J family partition protein [unclassified Sphingopyxis]KGB52867.1 Chromosome segregation DNA-binding protein [Sphingopyxis sp. LC363]MDT7530174.1 ParB/RepB/Spo0J family partition protein [Sphingopyxis sp. SE2]
MADNEKESGATPIRKRPSGLGRGLNALFGDAAVEAPVLATPGSAARAAPVVGDAVQHVPVGAIRPLPGQPRRHFDENAIAELADSIGLRGLLQPIIVRRSPDGEGFQLVAGERRWRAAQRAGLHQIPALVRELDDAATYEIALVENIQRQDLNAIEEASAYRRLIEDFGHNQEALAKLVGKSRSHVANLMRLLDLPQAVQALVGDGSLAMGHARALIGAEDAEAIARRVAKEGLSVRAVEALVRAGKRGDAPPPKGPLEYKSMDGGRDPDIVAVERHLSELLGIGVAIQYAGEGKGALTLKFASLDQLDMICQRLSGEGI